ncbi:MAG: hypothetical protein ABSF34_19075, partial [Verrucomicrobiota bacterium]
MQPIHPLIDLAINAVGHPAPVDTVLGLVINGNSLDHAYVVDWKNKVVPVNSIQFEVTATLRVPNVVSAASDPLRPKTKDKAADDRA